MIRRTLSLVGTALAVSIAAALPLGVVAQSPVAPSTARTRVMVNDGVMTWVVGPDREVMASGRPIFSRGGCGRLIGGTTLLVGHRWWDWEFRSLTGEPLPRVDELLGDRPLSYGGGERWSPDFVKVAMVNVTGGKLTVLDFTDPGAVDVAAWELPGLIGVGWGPTSDRLVVARRLAPDAVEIRERRLDGSEGEASLVDIGPGPGPDSMEIIDLAVSPDGRSVVVTGVHPFAGTVPEVGDDPLPVLGTGTLRMLGPLAWSGVFWTGASDGVAWMLDGTLEVADTQGRRHLDLAEPATWWPSALPDGRILVPIGPRALIVDPATGSASTIGQDGPSGMWAVDGDLLVHAQTVDGAVRLRWYRPDGSIDGQDVNLVDAGRAHTGEPSCLEVQPVTG